MRSRSQGLPIGRLIAVYVAFSLVPLAMLAFFSVRLSSQAVGQEVKRRAQSNAAIAAIAVRKEMQGLTDVVTAYAERRTLIAALKAPLDRRMIRYHLRQLRQARPGIATTGMAEPNGRLVDVVPATPSIVGKDFSFRDWYRGVTASGRAYVSEAFESQAAGYPRVVASAVLVRDRSGRAIGILVAAYGLRAIQSHVDHFAITHGARLAVTDQRGVVVAAPGVALGSLLSRRTDPLVAAALSGRSGVTTRKSSSGDELAAFAPVRDLGWTVVASVPREQAFAPVYRLRSTVLAITGALVFVIAAGVLGLVFALRARRRAEKQTELARAAAEQARADSERANGAKSEFLSRMSHELRTPLNAVLGFAQLLAMEDLDATQKQSVDQILKGGQHLLGLINEVLDISRIESGRLTLSIEPVQVGEVANEVLDLVRPIAADRSIRLSFVLPADELCVQADRQRLKQVLLNLLSNAVKYNCDGGEVHLGVHCSDETVRLEVVDSGPGIPPDRVDRLFTPFDRLGADQTEIEGTGLGLALSKGLVEAMGGTIGVETQPEKGSTFWVELARAESPLEQLAHDQASPLAPSTLPSKEPLRTVLYIEDNISNQKLVERVLAHRPGIRLLTALQGSLGLELAQKHRPDLVLLDLHLPDGPGDEVLARLRDDSATSDIPIVVLSADATRGRIARLLEEGADAYLTKPLDVQRFLEVLDENLREPATLP